MRDVLFNILNLERITEVVDVGANPIDGDPPYKSFLEKQYCRVTGFEPQADALKELNRRKSEFEFYLPYVIGDGKEATLNICAASGMTSLFEPDYKTLESFQFLMQAAEIKDRITLSTRRLDDVDEVAIIDFLKIDIQGGELSVFESARNKLKNSVFIQTEVSFIALYKNQPVFSDIDYELRSQGFLPHTFSAIKKWPISPCVINGNPRQPLNQLLEADVVYVKNFLEMGNLETEQLKHMAMIAHYVYGSYDIALKCIVELEDRGVIGLGAQAEYFSGFN